MRMKSSLYAFSKNPLIFHRYLVIGMMFSTRTGPWDNSSISSMILSFLSSFSRRVHLQAGETKTVTIEVSPRAMSVLSDDDKTYKVLPGSISFTLGGQQDGYTLKNPSNILTGTFVIKGNEQKC